MLLLGVVQAQAAGAPAGGPSYDLLATEILTSATSSVTFSSLGDYAGTYQHLQVRVAVRCDRGSATGGLGMRLNGDTGSNYSDHELYGTGSTVASGGDANSARMALGLVAGSTNTSNLFSGIVIDLLDPFETTKYPTTRGLSGLSGSTSRISLQSGSWRNTNAVTSIELFEPFGASDFIAGSRFSLYGLRS